jgi:uncharacterized membrane protein YgcG
MCVSSQRGHHLVSQPSFSFRNTANLTWVKHNSFVWNLCTFHKLMSVSAPSVLFYVELLIVKHMQLLGRFCEISAFHDSLFNMLVLSTRNAHVGGRPQTPHKVSGFHTDPTGGRGREQNDPLERSNASRTLYDASRALYEAFNSAPYREERGGRGGGRGEGGGGGAGEDGGRRERGRVEG